jgi:hypothetical protein
MTNELCGKNLVNNIDVVILARGLPYEPAWCKRGLSGKP